MINRKESEEHYWLNSDSPTFLVNHCKPLRNKRFRRLHQKHRFGFLFISWGNRIRHLLEQPDRQLFDEMSRWITGDFVKPDLRGKINSRESADDSPEHLKNTRHFCIYMAKNLIGHASAFAAYSVSEMYPDLQFKADITEDHESYRHKVLREFCDHFRDVAGNPFRPVTLDRRWLTENVVQLANTIDTTGQYELMPILADALQEADCESEELLAHCRAGKVHVRGCWAIDLLLDNLSES